MRFDEPKDYRRILVRDEMFERLRKDYPKEMRRVIPERAEKGVVVMRFGFLKPILKAISCKVISWEQIHYTLFDAWEITLQKEYAT